MPLFENMFPKHHLDTAPTDFQKSFLIFPPTHRAKASERIAFPNGAYMGLETRYMLLDKTYFSTTSTQKKSAQSPQDAEKQTKQYLD